MTDSLDAHLLRAALVTPTGRWVEVEHHPTIGSTNVRAAAIGQLWHVVVTDHQSQGRGRLARRWEAPPGTSVAVSATAPLPATGGGWTPLLAGSAVLHAVESVTGLRPDLKWPNDVLLPSDGERKVCGILCEVVTGARGPLVVIGTGLNISQSRDELPVPTATSLALAGAGEVDRTALVVAYLTRLAELLTADPESVRGAYRERCTTIGRRVSLHLPGGRVADGTALAVDDEGRLVVDEGAGPVAWAAGDVVHTRGA